MNMYVVSLARSPYSGPRPEIRPDRVRGTLGLSTVYIQASRLLKNYSCWILTLEKSGPRPRGRVETRAARLGPPLSHGVTFSRTFLTPDSRY